MAGSQARLKALTAQEMQKRVSKEQLLTPRQLEEEVTLESLGGTVRIRSLSHAQRQDIQGKCMNPETGQYDTDKMTMLSLVEAVVEPDLTEEDIESLRKQDASIIDELQVAIASLNLMGRAGDLKKESRKTRT
jgi:hypothetical protein